MTDHGPHARPGDFCQKHNLKIATIADLIKYRLQNECMVRRAAVTALPTIYGGEFTHSL